MDHVEFILKHGVRVHGSCKLLCFTHLCYWRALRILYAVNRILITGPVHPQVPCVRNYSNPCEELTIQINDAALTICKNMRSSDAWYTNVHWAFILQQTTFSFSNRIIHFLTCEHIHALSLHIMNSPSESPCYNNYINTYPKTHIRTPCCLRQSWFHERATTCTATIPNYFANHRIF